MKVVLPWMEKIQALEKIKCVNKYCLSGKRWYYAFDTIHVYR